ncbi:MAG: alpha/beta hydrolase [Planctomycetes bacterium]|nr:alpha/beta hydrolase [Planctomycetota bacterium]
MRIVSLAPLLVLILNCPLNAAGAEPTRIAVWPGEAPGETGEIGEEKTLPPQGDRPVTRLTDVTEPEIALYAAPEEKNTGAAVLVCPGGAYHILAMDLEGEEVARWLNSIGVTAIVLKYRVPRRRDRPKHEAPLQDAQRAMSLVRSRAEEWSIDPERIGILGFSAGGHLAATTATNFDRRSYEARDAIDEVNCRPDFAVLLYPAYLTAEGDELTLAPEIRVSERTPPVFFAHAGDDRIGPENSIAMYLALKRAGVAGELHVYARGGHGFGLRPSDHPAATWPARCEQWLKSQGVLR